MRRVDAAAAMRATSRHRRDRGLSDTHRRGPKRLEIDEETTPGIVRWRRCSTDVVVIISIISLFFRRQIFHAVKLVQ